MLIVSVNTSIYNFTVLMMNDNKKKCIIASVIHATRMLFSTIFDTENSEDEEDSVQTTVARGIVELVGYELHPRRNEIVRNEGYYEVTIPRYTPSQFQSHFRLTVEAFEALCRRIIPILKTNDNGTGRPLKQAEKQLLGVIWLLATPDSYRSVGETFNLGKSSLSNAFIRTVNAINKIAPEIIKWPALEERPIISRKFYSFAKIDGVIGAIDGTFIPIKAPKEDPAVYVTRKCNYAMTLQAIAEPKLKFTDAFIAYPGSVSDARVFRNSDIYKSVTRNMHGFFNNNFILGDKAYPLLPWCVPPYIARRRLTPVQTYFNTAHASTRQVVERTFALFFGRFRRMKYLDMNRTDLIPQTVMAACVLHNICLDHDDLLLDDYIQEGLEFVQMQNNDDIEEQVFQNENGAIQHRDNLAVALYNRRNYRRCN